MSARLLAENVCNVVQFAGSVVTGHESGGGSGAGVGTEAFRFATLRRSDHWSPEAFNVDAWHKTTYDRTRFVDSIVLWDHNLLGKTLRVQFSDDDFVATPQTAFDAVLPTTPAAGAFDDALGVVCEDGLMWVKRFAPRAARAVRLYVPAMGAGLKPSLNGIVGLSYAFDRNMGDLVDATDFSTAEQRTEAGYAGRGAHAIPRGGALPSQTPSLFDYEQFRYHLQRFWGTPNTPASPGVLLFDEQRAEQAVMAVRPQGRAGFKTGSGRFYPHGELPFTEHEMRRVA